LGQEKHSVRKGMWRKGKEEARRKEESRTILRTRLRTKDGTMIPGIKEVAEQLRYFKSSILRTS
jgi:hypothetical protein